MTIPTTQPAPSPSSQAITSLVLGILSLICCALLGPVAWYLGNQEGKAIREGRSAAAGEGMAKAGMILGIIGTILFALSLLWILFFGGMAFLSALAHH
jgi:uncharacterized protein DUF4190